VSCTACRPTITRPPKESSRQREKTTAKEKDSALNSRRERADSVRAQRVANRFRTAKPHRPVEYHSSEPNRPARANDAGR